jgi:energy-coupling factor transporter ATP-binding protein EcfA2
MKTKLIGLAGATGTGKSTIAKMIKLINGAAEPTVVCSFADAPRSVLLSTFKQLTPNHFSDRVLKERKIPELNASPRELLIEFGSEFARAHDENVWVKHAEIRFRDLATQTIAPNRKNSYVVFDDVRFPNEVDFIRRYGGTIIHLERNYRKKSVIKKFCTAINPFAVAPHPSTIGVRELFNEQHDWVINTSESADMTFTRIKDFAVRRFEKEYEL